MKRFTLLAACVAVLAVLVYFVSRTDAPVAIDSTARTTPTSAEDAPRADLAADADRATSLEGPDAVDAPRSDDVAARSAAPDLTRTLIVTGSVRAPSMCEDPTLEVIAFSKATDSEVLSALKPEHSGELARATVAANGSFEIALPNDAKRAHFTVAGRYLYTHKSVELDLEKGGRTIALDAAVGGWIQGEVEVPAGSPVTLAELDGTRVRLRVAVESFIGGGAPNQSVSRSSKCKDGRFEFRGVPAGGDYRVIIEPEKLAAQELQEKQLTACSTKSLRIALLRGGTVRGFVRTDDKSPVAGAEVEASVAGRWFGFDNRDVRSAKSNDDGSFELDAVTPGPIVLTAEKEGMLDSEQIKIEVVDGGSLSGSEILLSSGNSISGRVTFADGTPAADADVEVTFDLSQIYGMNAFNAARGANGKSKSASDGTFTVTGLGQGPFTAKAEALPKEAPKSTDAAQAKLEKHHARVDGLVPNAKGVELVLREPIGLKGRVVDAQAAPVKKYTLHAVRPSEGLMGNLGQDKHEKSFESEDGHFLITSLDVGKWELLAIADGFAYPDPFVLTLPRDDAEGEIVITLVPEAIVRGRVRGASGAPVEGATVGIETGEPSWKERVIQGPEKPGAKSGDDGTFELKALRAGPLKLVADHTDHAKSLPIELTLSAGQTIEDVEFVLRAGGTLTGEVFDDAGAPAVGLMVQVTDPTNFDQQMGFSDGNGKFRFEHLEPQPWQVVAMPTTMFASPSNSDSGAADDGNAAMQMFNKLKMAMVEIKEAETTHVVLGAPPTDPVRVFGKVMHHGDPFTGSMVIFYRAGKSSLQGMKSAQVDKDGNYSLVLDQAGDYLASVQKFQGSMQQQSVVEFTCDIPTEKEHRLDFEMPTARISGRIKDANGDAARGARVSLYPETAVEAGTMWGGQYNELSADDDGNFDIQALRPGRYTLLVGGMSFGGLFGPDDASTMGREVRGGLDLKEGEWMRDVDFRLKTPGSLDVTVVDTAGTPMSEAAVFVRTENGDLVDRFSMITTKLDGTALYGGLTPGRYTVSARKTGLAAGDSGRVTVEAGAKTPVKVVLTGGTTIVVSLVGEPEKPLKPTVSVTDEDGRELSGMLGLAELMKMFSQGGLSMTERRFGPFPAGKYTIKGTANGKTVTKTVQLTGQSERKLTLRFND